MLFFVWGMVIFGTPRCLQKWEENLKFLQFFSLEITDDLNLKLIISLLFDTRLSICAQKKKKFQKRCMGQIFIYVYLLFDAINSKYPSKGNF